METNRITYLVTFDCLHSRVFREPAPCIRELVWCPKCNKAVRVTSAPPQWRIRCQDCLYARNFGNGRTAAEIAAAKHRNRKGDHVVSIFNGYAVATVIGNRNEIVTPMLPE